VFAALDDPTSTADNAQDLGIYTDALAGDHVVAVLTSTTQASGTTFAAQAPYTWSFQPAMDTMQHMVADVVCRELSGHKASGSKQTKGEDRSFGVLVPNASANGGSFDSSVLSGELGRCHVSAPVREFDPGDASGVQALLAQEQRAGVTTLLPFAGPSTVAKVLMAAAEQDGYRPEWLMPGYSQQQSTDRWSAAPRAQLRALFGPASWTRPLPASSTPAAQALHEIAPGAQFTSAVQAVYDGLSLIAAGAQTAGPVLTPAAFAAGLETTNFANPGAGAAPSYQPTVNLADADHAMVDDFAQAWWNGNGFCLVGSGRRWTADSLPFSDPGYFSRAAGC